MRIDTFPRLSLAPASHRLTIKLRIGSFVCVKIKFIQLLLAGVVPHHGAYLEIKWENYERFDFWPTTQDSNRSTRATKAKADMNICVTYCMAPVRTRLAVHCQWIVETLYLCCNWLCCNLFRRCEDWGCWRCCCHNCSPPSHWTRTPRIARSPTTHIYSNSRPAN